MAKVELKQPIVQEISENIKDAQSVVCLLYTSRNLEIMILILILRRKSRR